jgi:hypothetical protein
MSVGCGDELPLIVANAYPRTIRLKDVRGKEWLIIQPGLLVSGEDFRRNCLSVVVRQRHNLLFTQRQPLDDFREPYLEIAPAGAVIIVPGTKPIENCPEITLQ